MLRHYINFVNSFCPAQTGFVQKRGGGEKKRGKVSVFYLEFVKNANAVLEKRLREAGGEQ